MWRTCTQSSLATGIQASLFSFVTGIQASLVMGYRYTSLFSHWLQVYKPLFSLATSSQSFPLIGISQSSLLIGYNPLPLVQITGS